MSSTGFLLPPVICAAAIASAGVALHVMPPRPAVPEAAPVELELTQEPPPPPVLPQFILHRSASSFGMANQTLRNLAGAIVQQPPSGADSAEAPPSASFEGKMQSFLPAQWGPSSGEALSIDLHFGGREWHSDRVKREDDGSVTTQFLPPGEASWNWNQMIDVRVLGPTRTAAQLFAVTMAAARNLCTSIQIIEQNTGQQVNVKRQNAGLPSEYEVKDWLMACEVPHENLMVPPDPLSPPRRFEVAWYKFVKGWDYTYLVGLHWHTNAMPSENVLNSQPIRDAWRSWILSLGLTGSPPPGTTRHT